jgi:hypothetical protein
MSLLERLNGITAFEEQIEEAQAVSELLEEVESPEYIPAVLAMFERNAEEDDFGVFHAYSNYIEAVEADTLVDGKTVAEWLQESVKRAPMWKTCELLTMFVSTEQAMRVYLEILGQPSLKDSSEEVATESLRELLDDFSDEIEDAELLQQVRQQLG